MNAGTRRWAVAGLAGIAAGALVFPSSAPAQVPAPPGLSALTATDVMLLNGVRQAGLWEMPAGQMAAEKGRLSRVREIGAEIARQHVQLDELVVDAANTLGVRLPDEPNADQKTWLKQMQDASGKQFDRIFVDRLRAAHGRIFPVIGAVRAGTRNDIVRELAIAANRFVSDHMKMLESTGLVRYADMPPAAVPPPQDESMLAKARASTGGASVPVLQVWVVLLAALAVGSMVVFRLLRWRFGPDPSRTARSLPSVGRRR